MDKESDRYILSEEHLKEIDLRKDEDIKPTEKPLKVNMRLDDLAKLMMKDKEE